MKSKTTNVTDSTQHQTAAPPSWTMPGLSNVAGQVTDAAAHLPTSHYSGPMVAQMDPAMLAQIQNAWGATAQNAGNLAGTLQSTAMPQLQSLAGGLNYSTALPNTSYGLAPMQDATAAINSAMQPVQRQLSESILPQITNSALAAGAYSGDRAMGVMPQTAIRDAQQSMQQIAATMGYQNYNDYENRRLAAYGATTGAGQQNYALDTQRQSSDAAARLQALGMQPDMINAILHTQASQGDLLRMSAELGQQNQQSGINDSLQRDAYASSSPFMGLDTASALLAQLSGGWGTTDATGHSVQTQTQQQPLLPQLLQGAVGIGGLVAGIPGLGGAASSALGSGATAANMFSNIAPAMQPFNVAPLNWGGTIGH